MRMTYERPVMMAELYETNAYCNSACGVGIANGKMVLDPTNDDCSFFRTNSGTEWRPEDGYTWEMLGHTFQDGSNELKVDGNCMGSGNNRHTDDTQAVWGCTCHDGTYYLEWSHNYTVHMNNNRDTFFLYHETNGRDGLQITGSLSSWPGTTGQGNNKSDTCVAQVVFAEGMDVVVAST